MTEAERTANARLGTVAKALLEALRGLHWDCVVGRPSGPDERMAASRAIYIATQDPPIPELQPPNHAEEKAARTVQESREGP